MTKKEIVRKVYLVFSWGFIFYITIRFLMGKLDIFSTIFMFVYYSIFALDLILSIVFKIKQKVNEYKMYKSMYKSLLDGFVYLQTVHKERYKLYFIGDREKVERYSTEIERYGNIMLDACKSAISYNLVDEKHMESVEKMIKQTEKLMTTDK